ncbi:hypothetical protein [Chamaesiphon sp. OTE_20_metabat_361]|uniref:hypothetical protein n=1 Tax=Chamaesiphon sp. OTE_20_metabat_361 TaxID=2964689 RepID=UPI00286C3FE5|nr:hypothetical protein [Chamaesiphon sp. OTE_20_metabat_361]
MTLKLAISGDKLVIGKVVSKTSTGYVTVISGTRRYSLAASGEIALNKNLLVVGSTTSEQKGKLAIFNLADATPSPRNLAIPIPVREIAIADKYIVVAEQLEVTQFNRKNRKIVTLFVNIADLSITSANGFGEISTYGNKLVRSYSSTDDNEVTGKIELFNLGTMPPKSLGSRNANILSSFLTNNYLFTVENQNSRIAVCIASSSK